MATDEKLNKTPTTIGAQKWRLKNEASCKQSQNSKLKVPRKVVFVSEQKFTCTLNFQLVYASNLKGRPKNRGESCQYVIILGECCAAELAHDLWAKVITPCLAPIIRCVIISNSRINL